MTRRLMLRDLHNYADIRGARDEQWLTALKVARRAIRTLGRRCLACGGSLWSRAGTTALYCDDLCRSRHYKRRRRYRVELRERDAACPFCGEHPSFRGS